MHIQQIYIQGKPPTNEYEHTHKHSDRQRHLFTQIHTRLNIFNCVNKATGQFRLFTIGGEEIEKGGGEGVLCQQSVPLHLFIRTFINVLCRVDFTHMSFVFLSVRFHAALRKKRGCELKQRMQWMRLWASPKHTHTALANQTSLPFFVLRHIRTFTATRSFTVSHIGACPRYGPYGHSPIEWQTVKN